MCFDGLTIATGGSYSHFAVYMDNSNSVQRKLDVVQQNGPEFKSLMTQLLLFCFVLCFVLFSFVLNF